jgi:hypothetical protein
MIFVHLTGNKDTYYSSELKSGIMWQEEVPRVPKVPRVPRVIFQL